MLTKHKDVKRLDPEKGVNKPFKNMFMSGAYSEIVSEGFHILSFE